MLPKVTIELEQNAVAIRFQEPEQKQIESHAERLEQIRDLVRELIALEQAILSLSDIEFEKRFEAIQAMELKLQISLLNATQTAKICRNIVLGHERISEHGFPEFQE